MVSIELQVAAVVLCAKFSPAHISELDQGSIFPALEDDVLEFAWSRKPSHRAYADLKALAVGRRRLAELSSSHLHVLLAQGSYHIRGGEFAAGHAHRVEPQAHGVFALSEDDYVAHAFDALQRIFEIHINVVADEEAVIAIVIGIEAGGKNEARAALVDADTGGIYFGGQPALHIGHPVLNIHRGQINVAADIEGGADAAGAIVAAVGGNVFHPLHAVNLLLQRCGHGSFHHLRACAVVETIDAHLRRRQIGKLRDWQGRNRHRAG